MIVRAKAKTAPQPVAITTPHITLGALLKLSGAASTGGQARLMIEDGAVYVDGAVCTSRGKKLTPGAVVRAAGRTYVVTAP